MAENDRLSGRTTRKWDGAIGGINIEVRLVSSLVNLPRKRADVIGWEPLRHELTDGVNPNLWQFRMAYLANTTPKHPADFANFGTVLSVFAPQQKPAYSRVGLSNTGAIATLLPISSGENSDLVSRLNTHILQGSQLPYIDVWDMGVASGEQYTGRYWLTNVSADGLEGVILTFADARARNYEKPVFGVWRGNNATVPTKRYFNPGAPCVFNPGGDGNMLYNSAASDTKLKWLFRPDWKGSPQLNTTKTFRWTCWDMLMYLWNQEYVQLIDEPNISDDAWALWKTYAGYTTPEVDIQGLSVAEAIDAVIEASGEFKWTLLPPLSDSGKWRMKPFHLTRYSTYAYSGSGTALDRAMASHLMELPTRGAKVSTSQVNVQDISSDERDTQRVGHYVLQGAPIIVESTFSTDVLNDYSCAYKSAGSPSGVASLEWLGNTAAFQTAYNALGGTTEQKLEAAMAADDVAYRVVALKVSLTSAVNSTAGFGFAPSDGSFLEQRRPFLGYRLPQPTTSGTKPAEANEKPDVIVWFRKPSTTTWIRAGSAQDDYTGGFAVDPVTGGIRFSNALVTVSGVTFTAWDVRVTAAIELDERLMVEIGRSDFYGKTAYGESKHVLGMRWNAMMIDGSATTVTGIIIDDRDDIAAEAYRRFGALDRVKSCAKVTIPWPERYYQVGDWVGTLRGGTSDIAGSVRISRKVEMPVVGVIIDYQSKSTAVRTENWRQK